MQTNRLFVDTSGWLAYLISNETHHAQAKQELQQAIGDRKVSTFTTEHVIAELVALMTARHAPRQQALDAVDNLLLATHITKLYTDQALS